MPLAFAAMAPEAVIRSQSVPAVPEAAAMSMRMAPPSFRVNVPQAKFVRPAVALPGSTVPVTVRLPTGPSPIRVAPEDTATAELANEPLTSKVPALTVVLPLMPFAPDRVSVPAPFFVSVPVPEICPA